MDCNNNHLPLKQHLENMLRHSGNLNGLPITEVSGHTDAIPCDLNFLTFEQLLLKSIATDTCGKPAIRVKFIDSCTYLKSCANNDVNDNFNKMFAWDSTAKTIALVLNQSS